MEKSNTKLKNSRLKSALTECRSSVEFNSQEFQPQLLLQEDIEPYIDYLLPLPAYIFKTDKFYKDTETTSSWQITHWMPLPQLPETNKKEA